MPRLAPAGCALMAVLSGAVFMVVPAFAEAPAIEHNGVSCLVVDRHPRLEARFDPPDRVSRGRLRFRPAGGAHWYSVPMKQEAGSFAGVLPKPTSKLKKLDYYVEVTATDFATGRTVEYSPEVVTGPGACQGEKVMAGTVPSATIILEVPPGAPAVPPGFSAAGIVSGGAATAGTVAAGAGGGIGAAPLIIGGVAVAGGAAAAVIATRGGSSSSATSPTTPTPTPAPTPTPGPTPGGNVTGRWIGVAPDGVIFNVPALPDTFCETAADLQLDLTQVGTALSGTGTLRTRAIRSDCVRVLVLAPALTNGTTDGTAVSFRLNSADGSGKFLTFSGVVSGNRMSGVVLASGDNMQVGTFAATRQ